MWYETSWIIIMQHTKGHIRSNMMYPSTPSNIAYIISVKCEIIPLKLQKDDHKPIFLNKIKETKSS